MNKKYLKIIGDENKRLSQQVEKVLQIAVLDKNNSKLKFNHINLHSVLKDSIDIIGFQIEKNKGRYGKELWSKNDLGDKTIINGFWETKEEAMFVSDEIEKLISKRIPLNEIFLCFLWGGVLSGCVNYIFIYATRFLYASSVTFFMLFEFALGPFWVWIFLNETISRNTFYGGILVMVSVFIYSTIEVLISRKKIQKGRINLN